MRLLYVVTKVATTVCLRVPYNKLLNLKKKIEVVFSERASVGVYLVIIFAVQTFEAMRA